jgi:hypothetical protein
MRAFRSSFGFSIKLGYLAIFDEINLLGSTAAPRRARRFAYVAHVVVAVASGEALNIAALAAAL